MLQDRGQIGATDTAPHFDPEVALIEGCLHDWLDDRLECDEHGFAVHVLAKLRELSASRP